MNLIALLMMRWDFTKGDSRRAQVSEGSFIPFFYFVIFEDSILVVRGLIFPVSRICIIGVDKYRTGKIWDMEF